MNVTLEKNSGVNGEIVVAVVEDDYAPRVKEELKKIAKNGHFPGFRQGHVPFETVRRRFGKQAKSEALNDVVYEAVSNYIRDEKLHILGEPMPVTVQEINLDDKEYTFRYKVGMAPELDVKADKDVTLPYYTIEVSDEMVKEQDASLCERFGKQVSGDEVDAKAVVKGVLMQLNADGSVNENEGAIQVLNATVAPFYFKNQDEAAKFLGKKVDDKVVFNPYNSCDGNAAVLSSMLDIDKSIAADVKGDFQMTISEIIVVKPAEHDQEFFDNVFGKDKVHNEEEFKAELSKMIAASLAGNGREYFNYSAQKYFLEKYGDMELPVEFLKEWLIKRNDELTAENIDAEFEQMLPSLKWQLIRERLASALNVKFTEDDLMNYAKSMTFQQFAQYGITNMDDQIITEGAKRLLNDESSRTQLVEQLSDAKLYEAISNAVTVENKVVSLDEFKKLVG